MLWRRPALAAAGEIEAKHANPCARESARYTRRRKAILSTGEAVRKDSPATWRGRRRLKRSRDAAPIGSIENENSALHCFLPFRPVATQTCFRTALETGRASIRE